MGGLLGTRLGVAANLPKKRADLFRRQRLDLLPLHLGTSGPETEKPATAAPLLSAQLVADAAWAKVGMAECEGDHLLLDGVALGIRGGRRSRGRRISAP